MSAAVREDSKKGHYRDKIKGYMDRAEQIKAHVLQLKEGSHERACVRGLTSLPVWGKSLKKKKKKSLCSWIHLKVYEKSFYFYQALRMC